jgi:hypothetical protein
MPSTASLPTGTIIAPPAPWTMRQATSSPRPLLVEHSDATVKMTIAVRNTLRVPNRDTIHPLSGISTARVTR